MLTAKYSNKVSTTLRKGNVLRINQVFSFSRVSIIELIWNFSESVSSHSNSAECIFVTVPYKLCFSKQISPPWFPANTWYALLLHQPLTKYIFLELTFLSILVKEQKIWTISLCYYFQPSQLVSSVRKFWIVIVIVIMLIWNNNRQMR